MRRKVLTICGLLAVVWAVIWCAVIAQAFAGESMDHILASGKLNAAEHEIADGYFTVGEAVTILAHPKGIPHVVLREHAGQEIEILIRRKQPRGLSEVKR